MKETKGLELKATEEKEVLKLIEQFLPETEVWAYGSRVTFKAKPQSDLDLVVFSRPEQELAVASLIEAFEESSLPFRVDLHVWHDLPDTFKKNIQAQKYILQKKR